MVAKPPRSVNTATPTAAVLSQRVKDLSLTAPVANVVCVTGMSVRFWTTVAPAAPIDPASTTFEFVATCAASIVKLPAGIPAIEKAPLRVRRGAEHLADFRQAGDLHNRTDKRRDAVSAKRTADERARADEHDVDVEMLTRPADLRRHVVLSFVSKSIAVKRMDSFGEAETPHVIE